MIVEWVEPDKQNGEVVCSLLVSEAVEKMRSLAVLKNFNYTSDADALDDFVEIHWAILKG